jgi:hypothetical protein
LVLAPRVNNPGLLHIICAQDAQSDLYPDGPVKLGHDGVGRRATTSQKSLVGAPDILSSLQPDRTQAGAFFIPSGTLLHVQEQVHLAFQQ